MNDDIRRARTAYRWAGVIAPLALLMVTIVVVASWLPELPDPIASHWAPAGADAFAPKWTALLVPLLGIALVAGMAASVVSTSRPGTGAGHRWSATSRFIGAMALGMSGMLALLTIGITGLQRGLSDASQAGEITAWVFVSLGAWIVLGLIGWFLQPDVTVAAGPPHPIAAVPLGATERAVWFGTVSITLPGRIAIAAATGAVLAAAVVALAVGQTAGWMLLGTAAFLGFLMAISFVFRVRVSDQGLRVRSLVGWPDTRIPLDDIAAVAVVPLDPFAEFGGWGWRHGFDGRRGVVMRRGEALQVTERSGKAFVVTVDGAAEAAAVLQALKDRRTAADSAAEGEG